MRWREALLLVLRLTGLGLGLGIRHVWQLVNAGEGLPDQLAAGPGQEAAQELALAGVAAQAMRLLFASCAGSLVMLAITMRMRLRCAGRALAGCLRSRRPLWLAGQWMHARCQHCVAACRPLAWFSVCSSHTAPCR